MHPRSPVVPTLMLGVLLVGCNKPTAPQYVDVTGTWTYAASNMIGTDSLGQAVSCSASGSMSLAKSGSGTQTIPDIFGGTITVSVFNGTYSNLRLLCTVNGAQQTRGPVAGAVSVGQIFPYAPTTGSFNFDNDPDSVVSTWYNFNAVMSADQMTAGSVTANIGFGAPIGTVLLAGAFSATNQH
jgi:hypothetical protein